MITTEQRRILKKYLRGEYIKDVLLKLEEKNIYSKTGNIYSDKMISHVFNGRYSNHDIEAAIVEVYVDRKKEEAKQRRNLNKLLGIENDDENEEDS